MRKVLHSIFTVFIHQQLDLIRETFSACMRVQVRVCVGVCERERQDYFRISQEKKDPTEAL